MQAVDVLGDEREAFAAGEGLPLQSRQGRVAVIGFASGNVAASLVVPSADELGIPRK